MGSPQGHAVHQLIGPLTCPAFSKTLWISERPPAIQPPVGDMAERSNPLCASQTSTELSLECAPPDLQHVAKALNVEAHKKKVDPAL